MLIKTLGLVIKQRNIGENDKIITILTKELGIVEASAKGVKKMRSNLSGGTQLLCYSEFCLFQGKNYYSINSATTVNSFYDLRLDVTRFSLASYLCDVTAYIAPTNENSWVYLRFLLNTLHMIQTDKRTSALLKSIFEFKTMALNGFMADLVACNNCACFTNDLFYFLPIEGIIICQDCLPKLSFVPQLKYTTPLAVLQAMRHIIYADDNKIFSFNLSGSSLEQLSFITENYLLIHTKSDFNSLQVYKQLNSPL